MKGKKKMTNLNETKKTKSKYVTADSLFGTPFKRRFAECEVEGFGKFRVQNVSAGEQNKLNRANYSKAGQVLTGQMLKVNARMLVACIVDEEGSPVFTELDVDNLLNLDAAIFDKVVNCCSEHCGFNEEEVKN